MRETGEYPVIKLYAFLKTGNEILSRDKELRKLHAKQALLRTDIMK